MPVFIQQPDAFDIMVSVEGEWWKEYQLKPKNQDAWSFYGNLEAWKKASASMTEERRSKPHLMDLPIPATESYGVIYGWHGYNRYTVRMSGEIWFIELLACGPADVRRAREAGFKFL